MMNRKRQRKFIIKERRKEARKIQTELNAYYRNPSHWVEPDRPIINKHRPWKRSFKIRYPHISSHHNKIAREVLPLINNYTYCEDKRFIEWHRLAFGYKYSTEITQRLSWIDGRTFDKLTAEQQEFFNPVPWWKLDFSLRQYWARLRVDARYYEFKRPYLYDFKIEKNYLERVRVFDPVEESKHQENRERFYGTSDMYDKKAKLLNFNNENHPGYRYRDRVANKIAEKEFNEIKIDKIRGGNDDD